MRNGGAAAENETADGSGTAAVCFYVVGSLSIAPSHSVSRLLLGLRFEDLLISERPQASEALELADSDVVAGRLRRLKRASDLSYKAKELPDYAPDMKLEPFKTELWEDIQKIEKRNEEYELLDSYKK